MASESSPSKMRYVTLLRRSGLAPAEYMLLMTIWTYSDEKMGSAFPSVNQLADDTGLSPRYVKTVRKKLEDRGFLILKSRGGRKQGKPEASEYRLALPPSIPPQMGDPQITPSEEMGDPQIPSRVIHRSEMGDPQITPSDPYQIIDQIPPGHDSSAPHPPLDASQSGEGFEEWINLFPNTKRRNVADARTKYAETITSGISHRDLIDGTRTYLDRENSRTDDGAGGKFISQALKVLEEGKWKAPALSTAEAIKEAGKIDRRMRELRDAGDDDGATALFHAELAPIIEKHDLIRDEWGIGFRKKPKPFNSTEWSMS